MIPFIRSHIELMAISNSREQLYKSYLNDELHSVNEDSPQRKRCLKSRNQKVNNLANLRKNTRDKWIKSSKTVSKFINELDYNNQIQSSYDLTLIERQNKNDYQDAA